MLFHPGQLLFFLQKVCHMLHVILFPTLQVYTPKLVQCGMACVTQNRVMYVDMKLRFMGNL